MVAPLFSASSSSSITSMQAPSATTTPSLLLSKGLLAEGSLLFDKAPDTPYPPTQTLQTGASVPPAITGPLKLPLRSLNASPMAPAPDAQAFEMPRQCPLMPSFCATYDGAMLIVVAGMR